MNAITTMGANVLVPENMDQAMRLATAMANAKMVPKHLQGDVGTCLMVVEQAMRWRASPFAVAQCTSNIGGTLAYQGKLIAAILPSCGAITGELNYEYHGDAKKPQTLSVTVSGVRASDGEVKTIDLDWSTAKTDNKYWTLQPEQQLCYAGARVWARRWTPGPLLGIYAPEEFSEQKREAFSGPTIEHAAPVSAPVPETSPEQTDSHRAEPRKQTVTQWLDALALELANASTAEVDAILARSDVQSAQDKLRNGALDRLNHLLQEAIARTAETSAPDEADDGLYAPGQDPFRVPATA